MPASMTEVHEAGGHREYPRRKCPLCQQELGAAGVEQAREARMQEWFPGRTVPPEPTGSKGY